MTALLTKLMNDEAGFIVSAELVMIATLGVLAMAVGLSEVAWNINNELKDVGRAFGSMNQSFNLQGQTGNRGGNGGSSFNDTNNSGNSDIQAGSHIDFEQ
jgi:Flp pilus assembly pilin Flp